MDTVFLNLPAGGVILQVKVCKVNHHCHAVWDWNPVTTVHIVWVVVWISRT